MSHGNEQKLKPTSHKAIRKREKPGTESLIPTRQGETPDFRNLGSRAGIWANHMSPGVKKAHLYVKKSSLPFLNQWSKKTIALFSGSSELILSEGG